MPDFPVPQDQFANVDSSLTIEELDVTFPGGKLRKLILLGAALPLKGSAKWAADNRLATTWFVGNGLEASQQVLGPTELPTQMSGKWNRTRLGRLPSLFYDETGTREQVVDPKRLWDILDDFRIAAPRLRVTWSANGREVAGASTDRVVDFSVVREGRIKLLDISPERHCDINWTLEFHWVSRGGRLERVASARSDEDVAKITTSLTDAIDNLDTYTRTAAIVSRNARVLNSASKLSLGRLEALARSPRALVDRSLAKLRYNMGQFRRAADIAKTIVTTSAAIESSVVGFADNTSAVADDLVDSFGRIPYELGANKSRVADTARAQRHFGQIVDEHEKISRAAIDLALRLRRTGVNGGNRGAVLVREGSSSRAGTILDVYACRAGDTPARISMRFYGNADQAKLILDANRLPGHTPTFETGQILVIPSLATSPAP